MIVHETAVYWLHAKIRNLLELGNTLQTVALTKSTSDIVSYQVGVKDTDGNPVFYAFEYTNREVSIIKLKD